MIPEPVLHFVGYVNGAAPLERPAPDTEGLASMQHNSTTVVPYGYCHCGCGGIAPRAPQAIRKLGLKRGEPYRYIRNHQTKRPPDSRLPICECGCGAKTRPHQRFIHGHNSRQDRKPVRYIVTDMGFTSPCWIWQLATNQKGYGTTSRRRKAHRVYYERVNGPVPSGLELDHLCNIRRCVNPDHLEAVTHAENMRRAAERRRGV